VRTTTVRMRRRNILPVVIATVRVTGRTDGLIL
jgi:hypothetical protein